MGRFLFAALGATTMALAACSSLESSSDTWQSLYGEAGSGSESASMASDAGMPEADATVTPIMMTPSVPFDCTQGINSISVPPPPSPTGRVRYRVPIVDLVTLQPIKDLKVTACLAGDIQCVVPITSAKYTTDPARPFLNTIELPYGFSGYLRLMATGYIPTEYLFNGSLVGHPATSIDPDGTPFVFGEPIAMPTFIEIDTDFLPLLNVAYDPAKGILAARTLDCNGKRASGVTLNLDPNSGIQYTLLGSTAVHRSPPTPTDTTGSGGFANIVPSTYNLAGLLPSGAPNAGTAYGLRAINIKSGYLTITEIRTDDYKYGR